MDTRLVDLVARVNPVNDDMALLVDEDELESLRRLVKDRSINLEPTIETTRDTQRSNPLSVWPPTDQLGMGRSRRFWGTAVAVGIAAAIVLIAAIVGGAFETATKVDLVDTPADDVVADDEARVVAAEALAAVAEYEAAVEAGVDPAVEVVGPNTSPTVSANIDEFWAVFSEAGMPNRTDGCDVTRASSTTAQVLCAVSVGDPVLVAVGGQQQSASYLWEDGVLRRLAWQDDPTQVAAAAAYVDYLSAVRLEAYRAVCTPGAYEFAEVTTSRGDGGSGYVYSRECAELLVAHAHEVAQWVRDGRPPLPG